MFKKGRTEKLRDIKKQFIYLKYLYMLDVYI